MLPLLSVRRRRLWPSYSSCTSSRSNRYVETPNAKCTVEHGLRYKRNIPRRSCKNGGTVYVQQHSFAVVILNQPDVMNG